MTQRVTLTDMSRKMTFLQHVPTITCFSFVPTFYNDRKFNLALIRRHIGYCHHWFLIVQTSCYKSRSDFIFFACSFGKLFHQLLWGHWFIFLKSNCFIVHVFVATHTLTHAWTNTYRDCILVWQGKVGCRLLLFTKTYIVKDVQRAF